MPAPARKPSLVVDTHVRVAAWLHIALALITFGFICIMALGLAALSQWGAPSGDLFLGLGGTILLGLGIFPVVQVFGAARLLAGRTSGRIITLVFSVIYLLKFPVGTAICVYSFWVLLREQPQPARRAAGAGHHRTGTGDQRPPIGIGGRALPRDGYRRDDRDERATAGRARRAAGGAGPAGPGGARPVGRGQDGVDADRAATASGRDTSLLSVPAGTSSPKTVVSPSCGMPAAWNTTSIGHSTMATIPGRHRIPHLPRGAST